ncbi:MAG: glutathione S-transferase family protein [Parvularculaceae bacterium]
MKLYGHFMSAPSNQARLSASAIGVDVEYVHVDLTQGDQRKPEHLAVNPFGKVPALEDDGFRLSESGAISRYLAARENSPLYPADPQRRAVVDQWMDCASIHVRMNMGKILFNQVFAPLLGRESDPASIEEGRQFLAGLLPVIDERLAGTAHLCGDAPTLADIAMLAAVEPFDMIAVSFDPYPNVEKWRDALMATDWYRAVHDHYGAELKAA